MSRQIPESVIVGSLVTEGTQLIDLTDGLCAGSASTAASKAAAISNSVNGSGFPETGRLADNDYLTSLEQNPATFFNVSAAYVETDPPGVLSISAPSKFSS